ncbi:hypothetical protein F9288_05915 [Sphingomonas sp. CL5.1]|uniref:hypothetical protein n=1 Tax=Sphingomonas sp. CL5.1 TaxID=2653203 RepID=UPI001581C32A|nr:hypothetical protein [Sphingomonas sp. CL5.1]MBN8840936.1 hypothetical protein [Sphingomonadales bacterium]QKR99237.1 hypothetical protein F9288_05915 [Sphingomonas sp. CL5.1]
MAAIPLTESAVRTLKRGLIARFPGDKSSHLSEALAAALRFNTNMSLVDAVRRTDVDDPDILLLDEAGFLERLQTVARRPLTSSDRALIFDNLRIADDGQLIRTRSVGFTKVRYDRSKRRLAWRNLMVHAINAGIAQRLFTVRPGDNRWPGARKDRFDENIAATFRFEIDGMPAVGSVHDAGYDELSVHVALWPTKDAEYWVPAVGAGKLAGEAFAMGWLERRDGAWLQVLRDSRLRDSFRCKNSHLDRLAQLEVEPLGYADRGSFKL